MDGYVFFILCLGITDGVMNTTIRESIQREKLCSVEVMRKTIGELGWTRTAIIHDHQSVSVLQTLQEIKFMSYEVDDDTPLTAIFQEINQVLFPEVNVAVVLNSTTLLTKIIHEADSFDTSGNHSTDFSHHSKWLVCTQNVFVFLNGSLRVENLQNLAVLSYKFEDDVCAADVLSLTSVDGGFRFVLLNLTRPAPLNMFPNTQYGYNGRRLRVSTIESSPFVVPDVGKDDIPYTGFHIDVLLIITEHLNMTIEYVPAQDGIWGWVYDGMIGQLHRREIDLAASDLTVHTERARHVDFITPYVYTDERVFSYKMPPATQPIFLLAGPLKPSVYLVYLAVGLLVSILIVLVECYGGFARAAPKKLSFSLFWELTKPSLKQGVSLSILNTPSRLLLIFWWLLVMLISALYCGNLTATLATNTPLREFRSIHELVQSDFSVGFMTGGIMGHLLKNSSRGDLKRVYEKFVRMNASDPHLVSDSKDFLMQRVKNGQYAFASYKSMVEQLIAEDCTLSMLYFGDRTKTPLTFAAQKNSPFKEDIGKVIQKLDSSGTLIKLWKKWNSHIGSKTCDGAGGSVSMSELIGAVIVTGAGIGLASVSLILETVITWCKGKDHCIDK